MDIQVEVCFYVKNVMINVKIELTVVIGLCGLIKYGIQEDFRDYRFTLGLLHKTNKQSFYKAY